jgi:hypothetical protein
MTWYATVCRPFSQSFLNFETGGRQRLTMLLAAEVLTYPSDRGSYSHTHLLGWQCFTAEGLA